MYTYRSDDRWAGCKTFITELLMSADFASSIDSTMDAHYWEEAAVKLLTGGTEPELAVEITRQIIGTAHQDATRFRLDIDQRAILRVVFSHYGETCWPLIGAELTSAQSYRLRHLLGPHGVAERETSVSWFLDKKILTDWARTTPDGVAMLLDIIGLFVVDEAGEYHWHPTVLALLECGFNDAAASAIASNLFTYSSWGSRVPYIDKRLRLLNELQDHPNLMVRNMARDLIEGFEKDKRQHQKRDEEFKAGIL